MRASTISSAKRVASFCGRRQVTAAYLAPMDRRPVHPFRMRVSVVPETTCIVAKSEKVKCMTEGGLGAALVALNDVSAEVRPTQVT